MTAAMPMAVIPSVGVDRISGIVITKAWVGNEPNLWSGGAPNLATNTQLPLLWVGSCST